MVEPCPLIELSGSPRARGRQHGEEVADRVRLGIEHYSEQLAKRNFGWPAIRELIGRYVPVMERFDGAYIEEMRGIAEGAGVTFDEVVLLNARTEIVKLGGRPDLLARLEGAEGPDGCTGVIVLPEASQSNRLIHALNWDWKAECAQTMVVLRIRRNDGPDILAFTEAGMLARGGINAAGIAITANYLDSDRDYRQVGVPLALIRRKVLEQEHLALAMRTVYATEKSGSNNMIVSHGGGIAIDFECAPDETFLVHPERGLLVHANHWLSPVALAKLKDTGIATTPDSLYRDVRVRGALTPQIGKITVDAVKAALFDDFASPWSVCRPPRNSIGNNLTATVAMIVMEPALGTMEVAMLPALNREFVTYSIDEASVPVARLAARA